MWSLCPQNTLQCLGADLMVAVQDKKSCGGSGRQKPDSNDERAGKQENKSLMGFN